MPLTINRIALSVDYTLLQKQDRQKQIAKSYFCRALWIAWIQRALDLLLGKYPKVFFFLPREITSPLTLDRVMIALSKGNFPLTGMRIMKKKKRKRRMTLQSAKHYCRHRRLPIKGKQELIDLFLESTSIVPVLR